MQHDAPEVATRLLQEPDNHLTPIGVLLRKTSLDELPQLWSILKGDMCFVGPRPVLANEHELLTLRTEKNVHTLVPGLTGWAQVNGRDNITNAEKTMLDFEYLKNKSISFDLKILGLTLFKILHFNEISH